MWTLAYNGTEQALGAWGLCADFSIELVNKGRDTVTMRSTEGLDAGPAQFGWGAPVVLYEGRSAGSGGSGWTGGHIFFQGYVGEVSRVNEEGRQNIEYKIFGPWWLLERLIFQQGRMVFTGYSVPGNAQSSQVLAPVNTPEVFLGETINEVYQTNGEQVVEVLNWVNQCYNPTRRGAANGIDATQDVIQVGTIDPAVNMPKNRANSIFCSEALASVLRWSPDCVCWFDYTTSPPTFYCRALANLAAASATITAQQERQVRLAPKFDRQLDGVAITYKQSSVVDGVAWPQIYYDRADAGGSGLFVGNSTAMVPGSGSGTPTVTDYAGVGAAGTSASPFISRHFVELAGSVINWADAPVMAAPAAALVAGTVSAWQAADNSLNDPNLLGSSITISDVEITDGNGEPVSLSAYPNFLVKGQLSSNIAGVVWVDANITATVAYSQYADSTHTNLTAIQTRNVSHRLTLTNAVTGTYRYATYYDIGEQVPWGLALGLFNSLKTLQYAGAVTFVGTQVQGGISVGNVLTLIGPTNSYADLLVQSIRAVPHLGVLEARFSPSSPLDAPELVELARANRFRTIYNLPSGRSTGAASGSADVGLGSATARENTQHGIPQGQFSAEFFSQGTTGGNPNGTTQIAHDAQGEQITVQRLGSAGATLTADGGGNPVGQIALRLGDIAAGTGVADKLAIGVIHYVDSQSGANQKCVAVVGPAHADASPGQSGPNSNLYLGGGAGGAGAAAVELALRSVLSEYVVGWPNTPLAVSQLTDVQASCTCSSGHGIAVGQAAAVTISGANPAGYNGTFAAVAVSTTEFQYALASALANAAGTITAEVFGANLSVSSLTSSPGTVITATCAAPHGLPIGATLNGQISGASPSAYNGTFSKVVPISATQFTYPATSTPASTPATGTVTYQADVWVAKPWKLRCSRTGETGCDGTVYGFSYAAAPAGDPTVCGGATTSGNCVRTKTPSGGTGESEYVSPDWLQGDVFYAVPANTSVQVNQSGNIFNLGLAGIEETRAWTAVSS